MSRRIAIALGVLAAFLAAPATASADPPTYVRDGVLIYTSGPGKADSVRLHRAFNGWLRLTVDGPVGQGCAHGAGSAFCDGVTSASLSTLDGDDDISVEAALPTTIDAGPGEDVVTAGPADDTIEARDGSIDRIDCGAGADTAYADPGDVLIGCELPAAVANEPVPDPLATEPGTDEPAAAGEDPTAAGDQQPGGGGDATLPVTPAIAPPALDVAPARVTQTVATVDAGGTTSLEIACPASEPAGCRGGVHLDPGGRRKGRPGRFGRARFAAAAGETIDVRIRLTKAARRARGMPSGNRARAARRGRVKAIVTITQPGRKPVKSKVKLKR